MSKAQYRPGTAAPLPREWLDTVAPAVRVLAGLVFIGWSWVSTLLIVGALLAPVLPSAALGIPDRALVALGFAILVSLVEFVASDRWPVAYWLVLLLGDASFTAWQTRAWLILIIEANTPIETAGHVAIWIASILGGIIAAKFGEVLLFGAGRKR